MHITRFVPAAVELLYTIFKSQSKTGFSSEEQIHLGLEEQMAKNTNNVQENT
jgi:hypothetical protein